MEIVLAPIEHLPVRPDRPGKSNITAEVSNRPSTSGGREIYKESIIAGNIPKLRGWFYRFIKSRNMCNFSIVLFIILSITIGILTVCLTAPKSSKTCERVFQRKMKSSFVSSSQPRFAALHDLNNDQQMDMIVANSGINTIGIFLSNGNGTFADQKKYSTGSGSNPYSVAVNDFNNDTYMDIIVANYGTNNIGIFLGKENGSFNDQTIFSLNSSRPVFLTTGDFNQDNRMDIAVVNYGTNTIGILLGYGDGSFQTQTTYSTGYDSLPSSLVIADFNNDSYLDIGVTNSGTDNIGIFLGYGNGIFTNQQTYTTLPKSNPLSIAVGDFNNDDRLDIVVANNGTGNIGIFFGYGNGSFEAQMRYSIDSKSYPQYVAVGDLNKDNILDIVVVDSQHNRVHILPGYGNGSFTEITTYDGVSGSNPLCVAIADLNSNNQLDIVIVNYGTSNVLALIDYSIKLSARQINYEVGSLDSTASVVVSDFNSDHILDLVYVPYDYIRLRTGMGDGTFGSETKYSSGARCSSQYMCVGDLNNDMKMDIVAACFYRDSVGVILGNGDGSFATMKTYPGGNGSTPIWVALGDVNNDYRLDIVSANRDINTIGVLLGNGDGTFSTMVHFSTAIGSQPYSVATGDLDHDNDLDLVVAHGDGPVVVFIGYGNGSFTIWHVLSTDQTYSSFSIALCDFNSDTYLDIVVANTHYDNIGIFLGYENATFGTQTSYSTGSISSPYYVIVADLNNDNISDIVATNLGTDEVIMFYGLGNGGFRLGRTYSTGVGSKPYGIVAADLDNNTELDLVVVLFGNNHIAILTEYKAAVFAKETKYSTGSAPQPYSLAVGDFNNDNRSDIVVANSGSDDLGILLALDNGTFDMTKKYKIDTDYYPEYVISCDINKDDQLDIVSVNSKTDSISVIRGYGNGTFAEQLLYSTGNGSHPIAVASGDINNDTRLDLVIANEGTDNLGIFFGFNYTIFQNQKTYSTDDNLQPNDIAVNDFNNDTYLDIAATFYWTNEIGILLGDGNGNFTTIMTYSTGLYSGPWGIAIDDLNNDRRADIVVTNYATNTIGVLLGHGNGSFTSIMTYSSGEYSSPIAVTVGDVNHDNLLDIVVANSMSNSVGVLIGYGNGNFSNITVYPTGEDSVCWSVILGDFDNNDNLDIAMANYDTHNIKILFGYGDGTFGNQTILPMTWSSRPYSLTVGDFNSDSRLDIAVADWNYNNIAIFIGHGNGTFASMTTYSSGDGSSPAYIRAGDFNNDNILDIAVTNSGTNSIVVLFGLGDGSFHLGTSYSTGAGSSPIALAIGDFNDDQRLDIVVANKVANNLGVFLASGYAPFGSIRKVSIYEGSKPRSVTVSDLDSDGCADITVANSATDDIGILFGYGNGKFKAVMKYSTGNGSAPSSVAIADFNNDTQPDIVVTNYQTDNISILLGVGNRTFAIGSNYSTGTQSYPYSVTTGDFNNDNITDIAVANSGISSILLLYGHGDGTFENQISYRLGYDYHPYSIAVKDLNQDNWLDIVVACYGTDHVETFIQMCL